VKGEVWGIGEGEEEDRNMVGGWRKEEVGGVERVYGERGA